jgi:hypothetical protein
MNHPSLTSAVFVAALIFSRLTHVSEPVPFKIRALISATSLSIAARLLFAC